MDTKVKDDDLKLEPTYHQGSGPITPPTEDPDVIEELLELIKKNKKLLEEEEKDETLP